MNTRDAAITLTDLPFLRLRGKLSLEARPFRELVAEGQKDLDAAMIQQRLEVNLHERTVKVSSKTIEIGPIGYKPLAITALLERINVLVRDPSFYPKFMGSILLWIPRDGPTRISLVSWIG